MTMLQQLELEFSCALQHHEENYGYRVGKLLTSAPTSPHRDLRRNSLPSVHDENQFTIPRPRLYTNISSKAPSLPPAPFEQSF